MQSKGKTFYTNFKKQHDVPRSIVLDKIQPVCDGILAFISDIQSDKYNGDASGYLSAYNAFFNQFDPLAKNAIDLFYTLREDVKDLLSSGERFNATQRPSCKSGEITDLCEVQLNLILCTEQEFLNTLPVLAKKANDLLDLLIATAKALRSLVDKLANANASTSDESQVDANKKFIVLFENQHDVIHTLFEDFKQLCNNVDGVLIATIATYFSS